MGARRDLQRRIRTEFRRLRKEAERADQRMAADRYFQDQMRDAGFMFDTASGAWIRSEQAVHDPRLAVWVDPPPREEQG